MGIVRIDHLKEDMILSEDVREMDGRLLLTKGQAINSAHIQIMKKWGIAEVRVMAEAVPDHTPPADQDKKAIEEIDRHIKPVFRYADLEHPAAG